MNKEIITNSQGIKIVIMFILGSSLLLSATNESKQDAWIAILIAMALSMPMIFTYSRLISLFPGKDIFYILERVFGRVLGKLACLMYFWYSFHLGSLVIRNFSDFIKIVAMPQTPIYLPIVLLGIICIWAVKEGIEVIGRIASFFLPVMIVILLFVSLLCIPSMHFENIKPVLYNGIGPVLTSSYAAFSFPLAETVLFIGVFSSIKDSKKVFSVYLISLSIGISVMLLLTLRNIFILGGEFMARQMFPSYVAVSMINIGEFIQRTEAIVAINFLFAGFVKICICLYVAVKGFCKVFGLKDYTPMVTPIGLAMMTLTCIIYSGTGEMLEWASKIYMYYAFPFQVIIPVILLVGAEITTRKGKNKSQNSFDN